MSHPLLPKNATKTAALVQQYLGEPELNVIRGNVEGELIVTKYGHNINIADGEDLCDSGGVYAGFPSSAAEEFEVICSDANDDAAGTGARILRLYYYDDNYNMFDSNGDFYTVDVPLTGAGSSLSGVTGMRIWRAKVISSGSGRKNAGTITVRWATTTAVVFTIIQIGFSQSQITAFTIPAGYVGYLKQYAATLFDLTSNKCQLSIKLSDFGSNTDRLVRPFTASTEVDASHLLYGAEKLEEKTDFVINCIDVLNANGDISSYYAIHLVKIPV